MLLLFSYCDQIKIHSYSREEALSPIKKSTAMGLLHDLLLHFGFIQLPPTIS